jgi:hypothetical protein
LIDFFEMVARPTTTLSLKTNVHRFMIEFWLFDKSYIVITPQVFFFFFFNTKIFLLNQYWRIRLPEHHQLKFPLFQSPFSLSLCSINSSQDNCFIFRKGQLWKRLTRFLIQKSIILKPEEWTLDLILSQKSWYTNLFHSKCHNQFVQNTAI